MPSRKSAASVAAEANGDVSMVSNAPSGPAQQSTSSPKQAKPKASGGKNEGDALSIEDLLLPRSLTSRLARGVLPPNTSIQKDAVLALTKSATVFISYLAHMANEMTDRKTIQASDVLKAVKEIEMDGVMGLGVTGRDGRIGGRLEREITVYEEGVKGKRKGYREKVKARESGAGSVASGGGIGVDDTGDEERGHEAKRMRRTIGEPGDENAEMQADEDDDDEHDTSNLDRQSMRPPPRSPSKKISSTPSALNGTLSGAATTADRHQNGSVAGDAHDVNDQAETDPELAEEDEEEDDEDDNEEEDDDDEGDEDEDDEMPQQDNEDGVVDVDEHDARKNGGLLAPNGRVEMGGSDDESD